MFLVPLLYLTSAARAQTLVYSDDFDFDTTDDFSGTRGWVSQYPADNWSAFFAFGIYAKTDDVGGTYGSGGPADNLLVQTGVTASDFQLQDEIRVGGDNDGIGLAFRTTDMANTYLVVMADGGNVPDVGTGAATPLAGTRLYRIVNGVATSIGTSDVRYTPSQVHKLRIITRDSAIEVWFDDDRDGTFDTNDLIISATDSTFSSGHFGLYCYDAGNGATDGCLHDEVELRHLDTDADLVLDPDDNCLLVANTDQTDGDSDGIGDSCDADQDNDGYAADVDCADSDASIHPEATETCDGVDEDCDEAVDESPADGATFYADADVDTYGDPGASVVACTQPLGTVSNGADCDDADADVNPDMNELPDDGIDQDCDGADATTPIDTDTDADTDADTDSAETDGGIDTDGQIGASEGGACSCAAGVDGAGSALAMVGLMVVVGRRRR